MVIKISNAPVLVRPQAGIGAADIVFEHYAEGGLTRFSAIFYSQAPDRVGSIRSARLIDTELIPMFGGLLAFSGASTGVETLLNNADYANRLFKGVLFGQPYFWRDETIEVPHNMFMNPNAVWKKATEEGINQRPKLHGLSFSVMPPSATMLPITKLIFAIVPPASSGNTIRQSVFIAAALMVKGILTPIPLNKSPPPMWSSFMPIINLPILSKVSFKATRATVSPINLMGKGDAILFRDGQQYDGQWVRDDQNTIIGLRTT